MMAHMETEDTTTATPGRGPAGGGRRLTRSPSDRVIGGVAGGLGEYFGLDPVLFRIGFVVLSVAGGSGLALYGLGWLLLPEPGDNETPGQRIGRWFHQKPILAIIGTVIAVNIIANGFWWGGHHDNDGFWGVVLVGLGIAFLVNRKHGGGDTVTPVPPAAPSPSATPEGGELDPLLAEAAALDPMAATSGTSTMWPPYPPSAAAVRPRPRPFLTPVTLSLLAIGAGVAALTGISLQTFLALALLGVGAVMVLGARVGRARGLLVVGLFLAAAATATSVTDLSLAGGTGERVYRPVSVSQVRPYRLGVGDLTVDLTDLDFTGSRAVRARIGMGQLTVVVPSDVDVVADTHVGLGQVRAFGGQYRDGTDVERVFRRQADRESARQLRLDLDAGIGEINVEVR
jgi:phage shock protein PspC (stress-responsive transcriptional regulator)